MADTLPAALRPLLEAAARERRLVTYRDLAALAEVAPPHSIHKVTTALEALIRDDHAAGRPLLSAVAVSRAREGLPGRGFFALLRELGRYEGPDDGEEAARHHADELAAVHARWTADEERLPPPRRGR